MNSDQQASNSGPEAVELNRFLASIEKRALRMADIAVKNPDDALDIVQDAMLTLARKYASKPAAQWAPLFHRILQNKIRDFHRRGNVRNRLFAFFSSKDTDAEFVDPIDGASGPASLEPDREREVEIATGRLDEALGQLPERQRQAFLLRNWEGLDVAQTAQAMGCSAGSVKTHYSRAVNRLREQLEGYWHE